MHITLIYQPGGNGQVAFAASRQALERRYAIVDGVVVLAGRDEDILHRDAEELLRSNAYRMPTPAEQEAMAQEAQASKQVQESTELPGTEQGEEMPEDTTAPGEPPALETSGKKKASGG